MESRSIKISRENYLWLLKIAAELQKNYERPASFDDAINELKGKKMKNEKLSSLAGSWKMSDKEAEALKKDLRKGWSKWKIPSV